MAVCGIGWNMLSDLQDRARQLADLHPGAVHDASEGVSDPVALLAWTCDACGSIELPQDCGPCIHEDAWRNGMLTERRWRNANAIRVFAFDNLRAA